MSPVNRRYFLKLTAAGGFGLCLPSRLHSTSLPATNKAHPLDPRKLKKYVDSLPFPVGVLQPVGQVNGADYYEVAMSEFKQKLHQNLPPTMLWGYSGQYPGQTIEVRSHQRIMVKWMNQIANPHYLIPGVYDPFLHGTNMGEPQVKTVVHVHGAHVPSDSDGYPEAWFTNGFAQTGAAFSHEVYEYPNHQDAATLWYHDHALGTTRLNVYAGLAGFYLIRDDVEDSLNLPSANYEVPLVIQDRIFDKDGSLLYPVRDPGEVPTSPEHPGPWIPEFFGDTILVNGKVWPHFEVEPRKYRFRILNGSNARFYNLSLGGLTFYQIAAEQGLFSAPVPLPEILLAPAERADVIVDFAGQQGRSILLRNTAPDEPFMGVLDSSNVADPATTGQIMQFRVTKPLAGPDTSSLPLTLRPVLALSEAASAAMRDMTLEESVDETDEPIELLLNGQDFDDPIIDKPQLDTVEVWRLINLTGDTHPVHLHLVRFQILDRQPFDVDAYTTALRAFRAGTAPRPLVEDYLTGGAISPAPNEVGWKDTVRVDPGLVTRIIQRFEDYEGKYPWHCHILEHEDNAMMLQYEVVG